MQIFIVTLLIICITTFIIYKINGKFEKKEAILLVAVVIVTLLAVTMYLKNKSDYIPNTFKTEYIKQKKIEILKLSSELLNNKNISSKEHFEYKFTYIIKKDNKEYLCVANNVFINKIEDEFVFDKWTEECKLK